MTMESMFPSNPSKFRGVCMTSPVVASIPVGGLTGRYVASHSSLVIGWKCTMLARMKNLVDSFVVLHDQSLNIECKAHADNWRVPGLDSSTTGGGSIGLRSTDRISSQISLFLRHDFGYGQMHF